MKTDDCQTPRTLYDKLWDEHVIRVEDDGTALLYVDRHLLYEVTSPQAFEGLALHRRPVWRKESSLAVCDHNVPTVDRLQGIADPLSRLQVQTLADNCDTHGIARFDLQDRRQGIVHVIGPEQGATLPGMSIVCGDSHTSTHGAFGALAFGVGTSEVEHVLATQTMPMRKSRNMRIVLRGRLPAGCSAKDVILRVIGAIGSDGGVGMTLEFCGPVVSAMSVSRSPDATVLATATARVNGRTILRDSSNDRTMPATRAITDSDDKMISPIW